MVGEIALHQPVKIGGGHADHHERLAVDGHRLTDDGGVRAETGRPESVAEYGYRIGGGRAGAWRWGYPAESRPSAQRGEVIAGDDFSLGSLRAGPPGDPHGSNGPSQNPGKRRIAIAQVAV